MRLRLAVAAAAAALSLACGSSGTPSRPPVVSSKGPGEKCTATSQCQADLVCRSGTCAVLAAAASCAVPGGVPTMVVGSAIDQPDPGVCVSTVRVPAFGGAPDIVVEDLGELDVGQTKSFSVPAGASSFTIVSQVVSGSAVDTLQLFDPDSATTFTLPNAVVPDQVKTPSGAVYYDDVAMNLPDVFYLGASAVSGTFTAPNTSAGVETARNAGLVPGPWSLVANDWANECTNHPALGCTAARNTGRYHLHAASKVAPVASTGALDVEVYLLTDPSSAVSTAASAVASPHVQRWTASLAFYLGGAGLCLGNVTFHDLPAWVHQRHPNGSVDISGEGPCDELPQLFTAAVVPSRGVHLFLVDHLDTDGTQQGFFVVGVDGSIPGPSGFPGTINSGAAVGLFSAMLGSGTCPSSGSPTLSCGTDEIAYIAAHEIGHWLGLAHTTESGGTNFDILSDTPECPCSMCGARTCTSSTMMRADQCRTATCGGGDNLMFWLLQTTGVVSTGTLSRDQGQVMRLNPAVR